MNSTLTTITFLLMICMGAIPYTMNAQSANDSLGNVWISLEHFRSQEPASYLTIRIENEDGSLYELLEGHDLSDPIRLPKDRSYYISPVSPTGHKSRFVDVYTWNRALLHILNRSRLPNLCELVIGDNDRSGHISSIDMLRIKLKAMGTRDNLKEMIVEFAIRGDESCPDNRLNEPMGSNLRKLVEVKDEDVNVNLIYNIQGDLGFLATLETMIPVNKVPLPNNDPVEAFVVMQDIFVEANEEYEIPFVLLGENEILSYQFTLSVDGVVQDSFKHTFFDANFNYGTEKRIFTFTPKVSGQLKDLVAITELYVDPVAYDINDNRLKLGIQWETTSSFNEETLNAQIVAAPNPFEDQTQLFLDIVESDTYLIHIIDLTGRVVYNQEAQLYEGKHQFLLPATTFNGSGIYFLQLSNGISHKVMKLVKL